jgi:DNA-binding NarL/FixJ family response regulator
VHSCGNSHVIQGKQDIIEGYKFGANSYVVKPVVFHQFIDAIKLLGAYWAIVSGHRRLADTK